MADTTFTINKDTLEVSASCVLSAGPERVWQAITDPAQIVQWWGPGDITTKIQKNEVRVGGAWRYIQNAPDGSVHPFRGEYKEIDKPHKLVRTFEYEPIAGHIMTETFLLEPVEQGKTKITTMATTLI